MRHAAYGVVKAHLRIEGKKISLIINLDFENLKNFRRTEKKIKCNNQCLVAQHW